MDILNAISELIKADGVSGHEHNVAQLIKEYFRKYTDTVYEDKLGSVYAKMGSGSPVIMIMAHMDEIGMIVTKIEDNGMLRMHKVGGIDPRVLPGSEVVVVGKNEKIKGIIGALPPHLQTAEDKNKAYMLDDLVVDTGLSYDTVCKKIRIGDTITFDTVEPLKLSNKLVSSKTLDDRSHVVAMFRAMEILSKVKLNCTLVFCASRDEETTGTGARTLPYTVNPDMAIAIDVTHGKTPGVGEPDAFEMDEISIIYGANAHPKLNEMIENSADEANIKLAIEVCMGRSGTDGWGIQVLRGGIPTAILSVPVRYMHTTVETLSTDTINELARLIAQFSMDISDIGDKWEEKLCLDD